MSQSKSYKSRRKSVLSMQREHIKKLYHLYPLIFLNILRSPFKQFSLQDSVESQDCTNRKWTVISESQSCHISVCILDKENMNVNVIRKLTLVSQNIPAFLLSDFTPWSWNGNFRFSGFGFIFSKKMSPVNNFWYTLEIFQNYKS